MGHHFRKNMLLAGVSALAIMLGAAAARPETFDFTGVEVTWTVPVTGLYDLTAFGAHGGGAAGGKGAEIGGDIELSSGTVLSIVVGGEGKSGGSAFGAGGGGGSFVFEGRRCLWRPAAAAATDITRPQAGQGSRQLREAWGHSTLATRSMRPWGRGIMADKAVRAAREAASVPLHNPSSTAVAAAPAFMAAGRRRRRARLAETARQASARLAARETAPG
jgi:hypothetical protein